MQSDDQSLLDDIARYNEDDVTCDQALLGELLEHRPDEADWRELFSMTSRTIRISTSLRKSSLNDLKGRLSS